MRLIGWDAVQKMREDPKLRLYVFERMYRVVGNELMHLDVDTWRPSEMAASMLALPRWTYEPQPSLEYT